MSTARMSEAGSTRGAGFKRGQARVPGMGAEITSPVGEARRDGLRLAAARVLRVAGRRGKWRKPKRRTVSWIAVTLAAVLFTVAVLTAKGFPAAQLSLNDGGVWVTNQDQNVFGRFNRPIEQLDTLLFPGGQQPDIDVVQEAATVFLVDRRAGLLRPVDVSQRTLNDAGPAMPSSAQVAMAGGVVALLDADSGKLWARAADRVEGLDVSQEPPTVEVGGKAAVTAGADGTVYAVSSEKDTLTTVPRVGPAQTRPLGVDVSNAAVTVVGTVPVVLGEGGKLVLPDRSVTVPAGARLQQAGPVSAAVLVATGKQLLEVGLSDGAVHELDQGAGEPAAPVRLGDCVHAAWAASPPSYVRHCDNVPADKPVTLEGLSSNPDLVFRVNRDAIVLNDAAGGGIYLFERGGQDLGNWQELIQPAKPDPSRQPVSGVRDPKTNTPPKANEDTMGARPGQAALLHVLDNDSDPDGDVLTIQSVTAVKPAGAGALSIVMGSQALQFTANNGDRAQTVTFQYTVDDGRGGSDRTGVTVNVRPEGNQLPYARPSTRGLEVAQGGTLTFNVLRDWRDDDGDSLLLTSAILSAPESVRFTPAGEITLSAAPNSAPGAKTLQLKVSDGIGAVEASIVVTVVSTDRPPVAENDLAAAVAGQTLTLRPLDNDYDPNTTVPGSPQRLRLSFVGPARSGASATPDYVAGTISFTAERADTYYLDYRVTDGKAEAAARIRVDVRKATSAYPPVAVTDQVALRGNTPAVVDVLANDVDLDGDVLVVRSVEVPENSGLSVSVIEHRWLRVASIRSDVGAPRFALRYTVSDGGHSDTGVVVVTRLDPSPDNQRPVAVPDIATVRVGDVVDVDVLANDSDPDGATLQLDSDVIDDDVNGKRGLWMVVAGHVRFHALERAGTVTASYTVRDERGQSAVGQVTVTVISAEAPNQIPQPPPIQARAFAGSVVRIQTPLTGVDPDGDSVLLLGPATAPQLGRIVRQGIDYFDYEAYPDSTGTDAFTYRVQDGFGGRGTGTVRVGVAPFPDFDSSPVAADDVLTVAPGSTVRVPVLANDSDVDGDPLALEPLAAFNPSLPDGASVSGDRVVLRAGGRDGDVVTIRYAVSDGRGQRATASVQLISRDGANLPPIARDDVAEPAPAGASSVDVAVLDNDEDLDGPAGELSIEPIDIGNSGRAAVVSGNRLRVPLAKTARQVAYTLKDGKGGKAVAFVRVPGTGNQPPHLRPDAKELEVAGGAELTVNIADLVVDPEGQPVRLTATSAISTSPRAGLQLAPNSSTETSFRLVAAANFRGQAAVVFEVEDGTVAISLSVSIKVTAGATAPVIACPPVEPVAGAPALLVNLARCVRSSSSGGAEGMTFTLTSEAPAGVTATLNGAGLKIEAAPDAQVGDRGRIGLRVSDVLGGTATGELSIVVRPSGLAVAVTDSSNARVGEETRVNVIANDVNPFPNSPLKLISVTSSDLANSRIDAATGEIVFTATRHGQARMTYTVQDATGKADRRVHGQLVATVIDKPLASGQPVARSVGDRFAVLVWSEPDNQGSTIDRYVVTGTDGFQQTCESTVCRLEGLTNGKVYRFKVRAHNAAGDGADSPESAVVNPDAKPDPPDAPTTAFGDGSISLNWAPPPGNGGSPIKEYDVEISPGGTARTVTGTSYVWTGLTNGAAYTFRVLARNSNLAGDWSPSSAPQIPARQPDAPQAPTAAGVADGIGQQIVVDWVEPPVNGAPITEYQLTVVRAGVDERTLSVAGDTTQATVNVDNGVNYQFRLVALNKAGPSAASPQSAVTVAHGKPFPVPSHIYSDNSGGTGYDGRVAYTLTPPNDNGMAISRYEFDIDQNGTPDRSDTAVNGFVTGLANGSVYQINARACNDVCGDWSHFGNSVQPYGPVPQPNAGASKIAPTTIRLSWSHNGSNGRPLNRLEYRVNGGGWTNGGLGGSTDVGNGNNQTWSIEVHAFDDAGQVSSSAFASAVTDPPTPPTVTVSKGGNATGQPGCPTGPCAYVVANLSNFAPNTTYTCTVNTAHGALTNFTARTNGSGSVSHESYDYYGYPSGWVQLTCGGVVGRRDPWG